MTTATASRIAKGLVKALTAAIIDKPPYGSGTCALPSDAHILAYKTSDGIVKGIDWSQLSDESQLASLAEACLPATKALKMDKSNFATDFNPEEAGLLSILSSRLLEGLNMQKRIRPELYKLNVCGKDSFFKSRKDTPRGGSMIASLVIVFLIAHKGGALVIQHGGKEWTFDSAKELSGKTAEPFIGYVAVYSDVDHKVTAVTSGYRITLTYNLSLESSQEALAGSGVNYVIPEEQIFESALWNALANPKFMRNDGIMGFGLRFMHPVDVDSSLFGLMNSLKGSDAMVAKVCKRLGLEVALKVVCEGDGDDADVMLEGIVSGDNVVLMGKERSSVEALCFGCEGQLVLDESSRKGRRAHPSSGAFRYNGMRDEEPSKILWITPMTDLTSVKAPYMH